MRKSDAAKLSNANRIKAKKSKVFEVNRLKKVTETTSRTIINVDIYYETECGDSVYFIKNQFGPNYDKFEDNLRVNFVPYGKAQTKRDNQNQLTFECQHGARECNGNKAHACGINEIQNTSSHMEAQVRMSKLVICGMSQKNRETAAYSDACARQCGLTADSMKRIKKCATSAEGNELLAKEGEKTDKLVPRLYFVPTIVINGVHSRANQDLALSNFRQLICNYLSKQERESKRC